MRGVVVTGGRGYADSVLVDMILDELMPSTVFVGDCPTGADLFAQEWAKANNAGVRVFKANWSQHGKSAGPRRNREMIETANAHGIITVLAFPGGRGTADCVRAANSSGLIVLKVDA